MEIQLLTPLWNPPHPTLSKRSSADFHQAFRYINAEENPLKPPPQPSRHHTHMHFSYEHFYFPPSFGNNRYINWIYPIGEWISIVYMWTGKRKLLIKWKNFNVDETNKEWFCFWWVPGCIRAWLEGDKIKEKRREKLKRKLE